MFGSSWSSALLLIATAAINSVRADTPSPRANHGTNNNKKATVVLEFKYYAVVS